MSDLTHVSLFTGIGGFDLAAEWAGFKNILQVEQDKFCLQVLKKNFPGVEKADDIRNIRNEDIPAGITVLSGGFPCQPFSIAGKRRGSRDDRYLWPEMFRFIKAGRPVWVVIENVIGITSLGIEEVLVDLESEGYQIPADREGNYIIPVIPAAGVGAPHRRDRVWIIACTGSTDCEDRRAEVDRWEGCQKERENLFCCITRPGQGRIIADANSQGCAAQLVFAEPDQTQRLPDRGVDALWDQWPAQSPVRGRNDGIPRGLDRHRLKALGNAVVPQVAYRILKAVYAMEQREF